MKFSLKFVFCLVLFGSILVIISQVRLFQIASVIKVENANNVAVDSPGHTLKTGKFEAASINDEYEIFTEISISLICCGQERIKESQTSMKSAVMFSKSPITFLIFTEPKYFDNFSKMHKSWPLDIQKRVTLTLNDVRYPSLVIEKEWRKLFRPCASLRLFLPELLKDTSEVLYLDTDVLFLSPVEKIWQHFSLMNSSQLAAVTPEHENSHAGWYNRFAKHPYYGKLGINSGVMLMNLTRMREFFWMDYIIPLKKEYQKTIRWGDQDILNILFHFHPELVYLLDCSYNYRPDHCMYGSVCKQSQETGVKLLHANRRAAHIDKFPPFRDTYSAFKRFNLYSDSVQETLYKQLKETFSVPADDRCGKVGEILIKNMNN